MNKVTIILPAGYYELGDTIDLRGAKANITLQGLSGYISLANVIKTATIGTFNDNVLNDCVSIKVTNQRDTTVAT